MNTWPISTRRHREHMLLGIPPRLGDGSQGSRPEWPTLEERVGDDWLEQVLRVVMPMDRAWLWWTRNDVFQRAKLVAESAPARITPANVHCVFRRNLWLRQMSVIVLPPDNPPAHNAVLSWAGADTEQIPDHLWSAPNDGREWLLDDVIAWCREPRLWKDVDQVVRQPAERVVTLFGGYVFCCATAPSCAQLWADLGSLATGWGLTVIRGDERDAWASGES